MPLSQPHVSPIMPITLTPPVTAAFEITFSAHQHLADRYQPIIDAYNATAPEVSVTFQAMESVADWTARPDFDASTAYHLLFAQTDVTLFAVADQELYPLLMDLTPLLNANPEVLSDFWPAALAACQDPQGRQLGIPIELGIAGIFYDREALRTAGIREPHAGWTWHDFIALSDAFSLGTPDGRYGFADSPRSPLLVHYVHLQLLDPSASAGAWLPSRMSDDYRRLTATGSLYPLPARPYDDLQAWRAWYGQFIGQARPPVMWPGVLYESLPGYDDVDHPVPGGNPRTELALTRYAWVPYPEPSASIAVGTSPIFAVCGVISAETPQPEAAFSWLLYLSQTGTILSDSTNLGELLRIAPRRCISDNSPLWQHVGAQQRADIEYAMLHGHNGWLYQTEAAQLLLKAQAP